MIEFTAKEKKMIQWEMIRVLADSVAECGPYEITKTPKRFKVTKIESPRSVKYYPDLAKALYAITSERQIKRHKWIDKYGMDKVYAHDR